ncbi:uncharacterized protein EDB91DRAFT_1037218, partial [Suillus paluster]|uniref:uncharacterized protein n=1 Tax=Suillus paluster TaxID=48578 RepID=UPI001B864F78
FISTADELFGPIITIQRNGKLIKKIPWSTFTFKSANWERVNNTREIIADTDNIQQYFSSEKQPTLWHAIPAIKELQTAWGVKHDLPKYEMYKGAIQKGLDKLGKYYKKFDNKPVYVLALVLHPYYKLAYITMQWGGPEEQAAEHAVGNLNAVDWCNEALKVVESTMTEY